MCVFIIVFAAAAAAISARAFLPFFLDKKQKTPISCFLVPALFQPFEKKKDACLHGSGHTSEGRGFFPPPHLDLSSLEGGGRREGLSGVFCLKKLLVLY